MVSVFKRRVPGMTTTTALVALEISAIYNSGRGQILAAPAEACPDLQYLD